LPDGCVAIRFIMLTYCHVRSAFEANRALPSNKIQAFKIIFGFLILLKLKLKL
jgi:hypothetical protein